MRMRIVCYTLLLLAVAACSSEPDSPEAQIKAVIAAIETAAEQRQRRAISEHIADSYHDQHGDKRALNQLLRGYLLRNQSINIATVIHRIQAISPHQYEVELSAFMAGRGVDPNSQAGRLKADRHHMVVTFVDVQGKGEWQVQRVQWQGGL